MQLIRKLTQYPEIERIFSLIHHQKDAVFLDSSLTGTLGRYSIIGLHPYLKLVNGDTFTVNSTVCTESFESFLKRYLSEHQEENTTSLPLTSGAIGYYSYDYGRKKEQVATRHPSELDIPDSILIFYGSFIIEDRRCHELYLIANDHAYDSAVMNANRHEAAPDAQRFSTVPSEPPARNDTIHNDPMSVGESACLRDRQTSDVRAMAAEQLQAQSVDPGRRMQELEQLVACAQNAASVPDIKSQKHSSVKDAFASPEYRKSSFVDASYFVNLSSPSITANFSKQEYMDAVRRMIDYIVEGDIYVANMTQQLRIQSDLDPYVMFEQLRKSNPSPFGGYFNYGDFQVVCASPERFLQMRNREIQTRPIKGTRKRGRTPKEDAALRLELEKSEKDQSELLMIVDLERNDLNRVCVPGSVRVTELFTVETYATVFHLISNIVGTLRPELNAADLIAAAFPGGSITGAPKLRAMEIIDELEHSRRGLYTGSMGYLSLNGDCDFNIVIRTALYQNGVYHLGVGGGITYESEPEFEYEETLQKAKALLDVLNTQ
jgi:para-aminobenzoate synthetase component 1